MKNILIPMTDFVLEQEKTLDNILNENLPILKITTSYDRNCRYAKFLKQRITKELLLPTNPDDGLFENIVLDRYNRIYSSGYIGEVVGNKLITNFKTLEDLTNRNIELKESVWLDIFNKD